MRKPERTSDLKKTKMAFALIQDPLFSWGVIVEMHKLGPYEIAEFHPWKKKGTTERVGHPDESVTRFHGWVDGKDTATSWGTLDGAIAGCIAFRREGQSSSAS